MCKWGTNKYIYCIRRNNDNFPDGWHRIAVDACIAEYVQEMNNLGIITVGCCCGHYQDEGIVLIDVESKALMDKFNYSYRNFGDRTDVVEHVIPTEAINNFADWEWQLDKIGALE